MNFLFFIKSHLRQETTWKKIRRQNNLIKIKNKNNNKILKLLLTNNGYSIFLFNLAKLRLALK